MNKQELIYIGEIIGTFGIKGELKVFSESDFIDSVSYTHLTLPTKLEV